MGKFISCNKISKGRAGSRCSIPGLWLHLSVILFVLPSLMISVILRLATKWLQYFQVSHSDTTMSREIEETPFLQNIVNTYFTGPCRSPFTSHWLELGNMPISKPIIDNEMGLLGFIETKRSLPLDLRLMWEGLYLNKQYWASAGSEGSERMLSR